MTHHLVPKMADVLYRVTYPIVIECWSRELFRELVFFDLLGERRLVIIGGQIRVTQQYGLSDPLLDQLVKGAEVGRPIVLRVTL